MQPHERPAQHRRQNLRDLGLTHAGLPFEEQRALKFEREEDRGGKGIACEIAALREKRGRSGDVFGRACRHAEANARPAITVTSAARYSALPCMSPMRLEAGTLSPRIASAEKLVFSACSIAGTRNTPLAPAPETATRTSPDENIPPFVLATKTLTRQ